MDKVEYCLASESENKDPNRSAYYSAHSGADAADSVGSAPRVASGRHRSRMRRHRTHRVVRPAVGAGDASSMRAAVQGTGALLVTVV